LRRPAGCGRQSGPPVVVLLSTHDESESDAQARGCGKIAHVAKSAFGTGRLAAVRALVAPA